MSTRVRFASLSSRPHLDRLRPAARSPRRAGRGWAASLIAAMCVAAPAMADDAAGVASASVDAAGSGALVAQAFERGGPGGVFELLADDAVWTVAGDSPVSGTYRGRQAFMDEAVAPIVGHLSTPLQPDRHQVVASGRDVVLLWDGHATANDGSTYRNSYAWHLVVENGRIVQAKAFLDTWALDALMR